MKKPLIVLTGPTAVGKTKLSIALAKAVNGEIISADSMQVYRHMGYRFRQDHAGRNGWRPTSSGGCTGANRRF